MTVTILLDVGGCGYYHNLLATSLCRRMPPIKTDGWLIVNRDCDFDIDKMYSLSNNVIHYYIFKNAEAFLNGSELYIHFKTEVIHISIFNQISYSRGGKQAKLQRLNAAGVPETISKNNIMQFLPTLRELHLYKKCIHIELSMHELHICFRAYDISIIEFTIVKDMVAVYTPNYKCNGMIGYGIIEAAKNSLLRYYARHQEIQPTYRELMSAAADFIQQAQKYNNNYRGSYYNLMNVLMCWN